MSRYDKKQGLDGIATLTNNPLAMDNIRKEKARNDNRADKKVTKNKR